MRATPLRVAVLSFLWPGLGHAVIGRRRTAVFFALPALVVALIILYQLRDGFDILLARALLVPTGARMLIAASILLAIWRLVAMGDAVRLAGGIGPLPWTSRGRSSRSHVSRGPSSGSGASRTTTAGIVLLAALIAIPHAGLAWVGATFLGASSQIYVSQPGTADASPVPGASSVIGGATGESPPPPPYETPAPGGRINVLIIGSDGGLGYTHSLTDSMIVVSVDPETLHADMLSFPRDISRFKLYNGGTFQGKLNSLATFADDNPRQFPDGGLGTLTREIGFLLGVPIHYFAYVNLAGFKSLVDSVGGVDVVNEKQISDANYGFPDGKKGFFMTPGRHHLDGRTALAYVRTREGPGDNDFTRARRQQQVLVALKARLTDPTLLPQLPTILGAMARTVQTDYPADSVPDLLILARQFNNDANVSHYVLGPPYAKNPADNGGTYMLVLDQARISALSIKLFGQESAYAKTG